MEGIGKLKTEADVERFVLQLIEQRILNSTQGLAGQLATIDTRLKKGGL
jgi:hypothetical protein